MKKIIFFIIILPVFGFSQTIDSLQFRNFSPSWIHYSSVEELSDDVNYFSFKPIVNEDYLLLSHNLIDTFYEGHLTEKINLQSGVLDWEYHYYSDEIEKREYGQHPFIDTNGNVLLLTYRENTDYVGFLPFARKSYKGAFFTNRTLNIDSGEVISESVGTKGDLMIPVDAPLQGVYTEGSLYPMGVENQFIWFSMRGFLGIFSSYNSITFNEKVEDWTWNELRQKTQYTIRNFSKYDINSDLDFLALRQLNEKGKSRYQVWLAKVDRELVIDYEYEISDFVDHARNYEIVDGGLDYSIIHAFSDTATTNVFYHIDTLGNLVEKLSFDISTAIKSFDGGVAVKLKNSNKILVVNTSIDNEDIQSLYFLRSTGLGNLDTLKQLVFESQTNRFICQRVLELENGNLLINLGQKVKSASNKEILKSVWIMIDRDDLDLHVSVENELGNTYPNFIIYPNPSNGVVNIYSNGLLPVEMNVYNFYGEVVKKMEYGSQIRLFDLDDGVYWIKFLDRKGESLGCKQIILQN